MSDNDPFSPPASSRHLNRLTHLTPSPTDLPLVHRWLHSAHHTHHLVEYHAFDFRLLPFRDELTFKGQDWGQQWDRFSMRWFVASDGQTLYGLVYFGDRCEGPPQSVHGGCLATFFDEAHPALVHYNRQIVPWTVELTVRYKRTVPLGSTLQFRCRLTNDIQGKRLNTECELLSLTRADGTVAVADRSEDFTLYASSSAVWFATSRPEFSLPNMLLPIYKKNNMTIPAKL